MSNPSTAPAPDAAVLANATEALYRAALGPGGTAHYLRVFAHFDERGLGAASWNHAAAWLNLNWLLYRRLWRAAAVYVLLLGLALAGWWWMRSSLGAGSPGVHWGLLALIGVLAVAVPGCWGSAWLHSSVRTRMTDAVRRARTVQEACGFLRRVGPARWVWLAALLAQAALVYAWLPAGAGRAPAAGPLGGAVATGSPAGASAQGSLALAPAAPSPAAPSPRAADPLPQTQAPPSPVALADEPAQAPRAAEPVAVAAVVAAQAPPVPAPVSPEPEPVKPVPAPAPAPAPIPQAAPASKARPAAKPAPAPTAKPTAAAPQAAPAKPAAVAASEAEAPRPRWQGHGINVGIFGESANAERAAARLRQRGLLVQTDGVESARGTLTRVRVGPFERREQAEAAAATVRELGLEAKVFGP